MEDENLVIVLRLKHKGDELSRLTLKSIQNLIAFELKIDEEWRRDHLHHLLNLS